MRKQLGGGKGSELAGQVGRSVGAGRLRGRGRERRRGIRAKDEEEEDVKESGKCEENCVV